MNSVRRQFVNLEFLYFLNDTIFYFEFVISNFRFSYFVDSI